MAEGHASQGRRGEPQVPEWIGGALEWGVSGRRTGRPSRHSRPPAAPGTPSPASPPAQRRPRALPPAVPGVSERRLLLVATSLLLLYGLVMAYSSSTAQGYLSYGSSAYFIKKQLLFAVVGVAVMLALARIDYALLRRLAWPLAAAAVFLLVLVRVPGLGVTLNGARRWINLGGTSLQPSEFAKLAAVVLAAALAVQRPRELARFSRFALVVGVAVLPLAILIMLGKDLSSTLILACSVAVVLVVAGARWRHLLLVGASMPVVAGLLILMEPWRQERIVSFLDPWKDSSAAGFQATQAQISVASGQLFGVGLGDSVQKWGFLPEQTTDMITGIIGEELGLAGLILLIAFYVLLAWAGLRVALACKEPFGKCLATGITALIMVQALMNLAAAFGLLPILGVPLPLVSCGGTSLLAVLAGVGILLNIATNRRSHLAVASSRRSRSVATAEGRNSAHRGRRDGRPHGARSRRR